MIPIKSLEKIENGQVKIRKLTARKLCRYYNVDLEDLIVQLDTEDKRKK
jgi:DNA-binding Xre family transcriptional regulator